MVKGISRRVVVVEAPDQRFFEQAIFIVRNDVASEGVSARDLVEEARRVARSCAAGDRGGRRRRFALALYSLMGGGAIGLLWLAVTLLT